MGLHLEYNADTLKGFKQESKESGVCLGKSVLLVHAVVLIRVQVVWWARRSERKHGEIQVTEECLFNSSGGAPAPC